MDKTHKLPKHMTEAHRKRHRILLQNLETLVAIYTSQHTHDQSLSIAVPSFRTWMKENMDVLMQRSLNELVEDFSAHVGGDHADTASLAELVSWAEAQCGRPTHPGHS